MGELLKNKDSIGVIIARMQVPRLTASHKNLIETVMSRHNSVLIILGYNNEPPSLKNPYSVEMRSQLILKSFPLSRIRIRSVIDNRDDNKAWVTEVDDVIDSETFEEETAVLYGSRDSFIPYYLKDGGKYSCVELEETPNDSGTLLREAALKEKVNYSEDVAIAILQTVARFEKK